ncbi:MAG: FkbM family methyltransferase [Edaphobacter sp.]
MAHPLKRLADDVLDSWSAMPKSQALRWYGSVVQHAPTILRERKLYSADRNMRGILQFNLLGSSLNVDVDAINTTGGNGYAFLREFFVRRIYFREFNHLRFDTCLDLGCNTGVVTSLLKQLAGPNGRVVGVDPLTYPDNSYRVKVVATLGITLHQGVLCGESVRHDPAALHAMCDPFGFDTSLAITVDELMKSYGLHHIDFLKMDIEGAEFDIFRDSAKWLDNVDNLAMEVHHAVGNPAEIIDRLQQKGFRVKWLDDAGYPTDQRNAGYLYASKIGSLKD